MKTQLIPASAIISAGFDEEQTAEVSALCSHLDCEASELSQESYDHYGLNLYAFGGQSYAVGTDEEADRACQEYIKDFLWAFNASFLADQTGLPEVVFTKLQEMCEDANEPILRMVEHRLGLLVEEAIRADGRGHFLSGYDGEENEVTVEDSEEQSGGTFYVYRTN